MQGFKRRHPNYHTPYGEDYIEDHNLLQDRTDPTYIPRQDRATLQQAHEPEVHILRPVRASSRTYRNETDRSGAHLSASTPQSSRKSSLSPSRQIGWQVSYYGDSPLFTFAVEDV